MGLFSWISRLISPKPKAVESSKSGPFFDLRNHGRVYLPAKGKFVQESHYANNMERFAHGLFPSTSTEKIDIHLQKSFELLKKFIPDAVFEKVYSDRYKREWTPANDGSINEYGQAARGNIRPAPEEELWQGNMFFKELPPIGTKFMITAPNGRKCVIQMGYEIGPGGTTFLGGLTTEVHYYLGSNNDTILSIDVCPMSTPLGPVGAQRVPTQPEDSKTIEEAETPWLDWFRARLGWNEGNPKHVAELINGWKLTKYCKSFTTIIGKEHSWCGMSLATALNANGYKIPEQCETAFEYKDYGTSVNWKRDGIPKGAIIVFDFSHVSVAEKAAKPGAEYVYCLGGNQNNSICVDVYPTSKISAVRMPVR